MSDVQDKTLSIVLTGQSGREYRYWIYELPPTFGDAPGNYAFAKRTTSGKWAIIYIGETENLSDRFDNHHAMPCAKRQGATHIFAHKTEGGKSERVTEETDLVRKYSPPCNK